MKRKVTPLALVNLGSPRCIRTPVNEYAKIAAVGRELWKRLTGFRKINILEELDYYPMQTHH
jgi:hypothetical protein